MLAVAFHNEINDFEFVLIYSTTVLVTSIPLMPCAKKAREVGVPGCASSDCKSDP